MPRTAATRRRSPQPIAISRELVRKIRKLQFGPPVAWVYNPLEYAWAAYQQYLLTYGGGQREILMCGMNPGPWGMAQTGVPFGEVRAVRDWLGISAEITPPRMQHPRRPIMGMNCPRSEISGQRVWGWAKSVFGNPAAFFRRFLIVNYCPLCFMEESGRNLTPDKLPADAREPLLAACDAALRKLVEYYRPRVFIGIGAFAEQRARVALSGIEVEIRRILHPSPASPAANRGWAQEVTREITMMGILCPGRPGSVSAERDITPAPPRRSRN